MKKVKRLKPNDIFKKANLGFMKFRNSSQLIPCKEIIGQKRAVNAINFGLEIEKKGYNIYLSGPAGVGKKTIISSILYNIASKKKVPNDWCYVYNFLKPKEPKALSFAPGKGKEFKKDMDEFVEILLTKIPKTFESKDFEDEKIKIADLYNKKKEKLFNKLNTFALKNNIQLQFAPTGIITRPLLDKKVLTHEQFEVLEEKVKSEIRANKEVVDNEVAATLQLTKQIDREYFKEIRTLENEVALFVVNDLMENLKEKYADHKEVLEYFDLVKTDIVDHIDKFMPKKQIPSFLGAALDGQTEIKIPLQEYKVNVIIDNSKTKGAPVVFETQPNYINLFGSIEREMRMGVMVTDFTMIRDGSICKANGGYLVVEVLDIIKFPFVWDTLKKVIENGELRIEDVYQQFGYSNMVGMRPEPIKINVKVIMTGPPHIFNMIQTYDLDFRKIFKIRAEFDSVVKYNSNTVQDYVCVLKSICDKEELLDFDRSALEATIEHSSRISSNQQKLSAQFGKLIKILDEANHWALKNNSKIVKREHVEHAIEQKIFRSNLYEEKIKELISEGTFMVDTKGIVIGQINGLSVYNLGDYSFGRPNRITCETFMGIEGVVNIERKARLSGSIHDKGVLILNGYIGTKFAQEKPLSLSASIGFEQSYEMIDGDSASAAELISLLSSLAEIPIKQNLAITGSVNQKGQIQPIGGVNEKIEGFFDICNEIGITGDQGVIIPHQNIKNLMLKKEVLDAVNQMKFHIYSIEDIDQGIELLTDVEAGTRGKNGKFKENTFNFKVDNKLRELAIGHRRFGRPTPKKDIDEDEYNNNNI